MEVQLPKRKIHKVPRMVLGDAYTVGSNKFESSQAKEKSSYYITFRRRLAEINPHVYRKGDDRILLVGLQNVLEELFYEPITHAEIDETIAFLEYAKVTNNGFARYDFPEEIWRKVVDEYNGRPPICVRSLPEGSIVYPNEPAVVIDCEVDGMGVLAAWFESKLLQIWAPTERVTQDEHFLNRLKEKIKIVEPNMSEADLNFLASILITDFGDRAGMSSKESETLGMVHLYTFGGTDTFSGAYQAWKDSDGAVGIFSSVNALAHRNVQSYEREIDCYNALYNSCGNGEIMSFVDDCYDAAYSVRNYLLPLALKSRDEGSNKTIVARPDSSRPNYTTKDQVIEICDLAVENGLYEERTTETGTWKYGANFRFLDGDGKDFDEILDIIDALIEKRYAFFSWGLFGVGGNLRNHLKRDNLSAKYALAAVGADDRPVVKASENLAKGTLPGPFKLLRTPEALASGKTILFQNEEGEDAYVTFFDGRNLTKPFGDGQDDNFLVKKERIKTQMATMPLTLENADNENYPASEKVRSVKRELLEIYKNHIK